MIFNSFVFWAFFAVVIALYWVLPFRAQNRMLIVAGYVFYGAWDWRFLGLLFMSTVVDYWVGRLLVTTDDPRRRKQILTVSIVFNLGVLGFFKYFDFGVAQAAALLELLGFQAHFSTLSILLPVGISFYTFQSMSYTIDVYRGKCQAVDRLEDFATFVAYFPPLVAGPIERAAHLMPQLMSPRHYRPGDFGDGLALVLFGMFKKVVVADNLAPIVNRIFSQPTAELTASEVLVGIYAFAFQIYGDFSGYSSIAQGVSKWMGIDLMWNFKMPYFARNPSDFWQRWHISLSSYLRDYLYIPLGGNRHGAFKTQRNLMLTMLIGGLWHGANWTFVFWGLWHGLLLVGYRLAGKDSPQPDKPWGLGDVVAAIVLFHFVCLGWLFFRAESMTQVFGMMWQLVANPAFTSYAGYALAMVAFFATPVMLYEWHVERRRDLMHVVRGPVLEQAVVYAYLVFMIVWFPPLASQPFIYFQF